jgi:hypothetical protein
LLLAAQKIHFNKRAGQKKVLYVSHIFFFKSLESALKYTGLNKYTPVPAMAKEAIA